MTGDVGSLDQGALDAHVIVRHAGLDAALRVAAGEFVAIMGPSGAGKTSLLEAISGLVRLDEGHVDLDGIRLSGPRQHTPPSRRAIGLLGQDALLFPHMTAAENIAFAAQVGGRTRDESTRLAAEWLDRIGLAEYGTRSPDELSGGQRQRIALARALAASPRLLLLDEPFTSLDVEAAAQLREVVREQRGATTTILVSHGILDAQALAERLVIVQAGRIVQDAAVAEVLASPATPFAAAVADSAR
ncbi:ATP-binding cassette domain-containing protein [Microbacterium sp. NPDC087592]|uniref:ATP-binding cassette domain-containing protein n=2 Tax=Bacillati TaxID=1783272 RepID=UPI0037FD38AB